MKYPIPRQGHSLRSKGTMRARRRLGCFGLVLGSLTGLLVAMLFFVWVRWLASPVMAQPVRVAATADMTLFLSERSLSRFASDTLKSPALVDLDSGGQMKITTRTEMGGLRPVVRLGLSLEMRRTEVVTRLRWAEMGFLKIPASWLPPRIIVTGRMPGEIITQQIPPGFELVGLTTTPNGIEFQLNWVGP
jgi:hypothetical protein